MTAGTKPCPTCKRAAKRDGNKLFPFCSERCQMVNLGRWLAEDYRIPEPEHEAGGVESVTPKTDDES